MRTALFLPLSLLLPLCLVLAVSSLADEPDARFSRWDKNNDGKLSREELPAGIRGNFDAADADGDGFISVAEDLRFRTRGRQRDKQQGEKQQRTLRLPPGTKIQRDIAYVEDGHERQKLDLYVPAEGSDFPLVIWVHGGAWRMGSKENCPALPLLEKGFAVASINYRLSQHAIFPAQINDCKAAVRWLRKNAKQNRLDSNNFGVWGSSAGGHLVALLGTSGDVAELELDDANLKVSSRVQAVCDYFGPTDFLLMNKQSGDAGKIDHDAANSPESSLIGGAIQNNKDKVARANPITYVSKDDPPILIVHGDKDQLVSVQQSRVFFDSLQSSGVESRLHIVAGAGHGRFQDPQVSAMVFKFFFDKLKR